MKRNALRLILLIIAYTYCLAALGPVPPPRPPAPPPPPPPPPPFVENYYGVFVNGYDTKDIALFVQDKQGNLWVSAEDIKSWHMELPKTAPMMYQGKPYYAVNKLPGLTYRVNEETLSIYLKGGADLFVPQVINANGSVTYQYTKPTPGAFVNYNLFGTTVPSGQNQYNAVLNFGIFTPYGVGTSGFMLNSMPGTNAVLRLLTTWEYDIPEKMVSWRFGDTTSTTSSWSGSNNFGGIQYATNFATQPYFLTFPQPVLHGQAIVPSSLNLFVNGALAVQKNINPGPYTVENIPLVDGAGNIRMVTKDLQGKEQVVVVPYYLSTTLLKEGLKNFGYEIGILRQNLGTDSDVYSQMLIAGTESIGITDDLTFQWHAEALPYQQALGVGVAKLVDKIGVFNAALAGSHANVGKGMLLQLGYQYISQNFTFTASNQLATNHFLQQGIQQGSFSPKLVTQLFTGFNFLTGTLGISYTRQVEQGSPLINLLTANYSTVMFKQLGTTLSWITSLGGPRNHAFIANVIYSFGMDETGSNTSLSLSRSDQNDARLYSAQLIRNLPPGPGYGYNISVDRGGGASPSSANTNLFNYSYQNDVGTYFGQVSTAQGQPPVYSLNAAGALAFMDYHFFPMRTINGAFGVAKVGGFPNVPVYANNQLMGYTDKNGYALIPTLLPYNQTKVGIDTNKLPFNSKIGETETYVAPYNNAGILIPFEVKESLNATMVLKQKTGDYVPEGASITVTGQTQEYIVGMNGETFLSDLAHQNQITVAWPGHQCKMDITVPPYSEKNPVPDLGTLVCNG